MSDAKELTARDLLKLIGGKDVELDRPLTVSCGTGWFPVVAAHARGGRVCLTLAEEPE